MNRTEKNCRAYREYKLDEQPTDYDFVSGTRPLGCTLGLDLSVVDLVLETRGTPAADRALRRAIVDLDNQVAEIAETIELIEAAYIESKSRPTRPAADKTPYKADPRVRLTKVFPDFIVPSLSYQVDGAYGRLRAGYADGSWEAAG
jgi:hypothetical protein